MVLAATASGFSRKDWKLKYPKLRGNSNGFDRRREDSNSHDLISAIEQRVSQLDHRLIFLGIPSGKEIQHTELRNRQGLMLRQRALQA